MSRLSLRGFDNDAAPPAAKVLTTSFADSDGGAVSDDAGTPAMAPPGSTVALITCTLAGTALTTLHLEIVPSPDGSTKRGPLPNVDSVSSGVVDYGGGSHEWGTPGTTDARTFPIAIAPDMYYFVRAKRTGGDGTSTLQAVVDFC